MTYRGIRIILIAGLVLFTSVETSAQQEKDQTLIEAQALGSALQVLAEEYDLQVLFESAVVANHMAQAIPQGASRDAALGDLLSGTDLTYEFVNERTVAIRGGEDETVFGDQRGASDSKNLNPQPVLMAQNQTSPEATTSSRSSEGGTSIVIGKVTDARTGANLKGAKVTIEETGQWTSTNDLGEFRFVNVPKGSATLMVSYLGYAGQSATVAIRGVSVSQRFALRGRMEMEEIIVVGQRSARALALNQERTADNVSTVLSSDLLGQFSGNTISDALKRAPGVAFVPNPNTGEGSNIIIRGLDPDLNQVRLNGVRLPVASGIGRSPDLDSILTESIESVTISKTLLPSQDSNGTGGLVEIETKSPLDRPARFVSGLAEYTDRGDGYGTDILYSGTLSGKFGRNEDFGASLSIQYREQDVTRLGYEASVDLTGGGIAVLPDGFSRPSEIDPLRSYPFEPGLDELYFRSVFVDTDSTQSENLTVSTSLEKQFGAHTNLRLDLSRSDVTASLFSNSTAPGGVPSYRLLPVESIGGEERFVYTGERPATGSFPGLLSSNRLFADVSPNGQSVTDIASIRGSTQFEKWTFDYGAGYKQGNADSRFFQVGLVLDRDIFLTPLDGDDLTPEILSNTIGGSVVSIFPALTPGDNDGFLFPGFTQSRLDTLNDLSNYSLEGVIQESFVEGDNFGYDFDASARYSFDNQYLKYIEVGAEYILDEFSRRPVQDTNVQYFASGTASALDLGLELGPGILDDAGLATTGFGALTQETLLNLRSNLSTLTDAGLLFELETPVLDAFREQLTEEEAFSTYIQGQIDIGKVEIVGGVRYDRVDVSASTPSQPSFTDANGNFDSTYRLRFTQLVSIKGSDSSLLPRLSANYRWNDNTIVRAGYFASVARPTVASLSDDQIASLNLQEIFGPQGDQPLLSVRQGNPNLESAFTHNYDLSFERYDQNIGVVKLGLFYKETENFRSTITETLEGDEIAQRLTLPNTPEFQNLPDNIFVAFSQPVNDDGKAKFWGVEATFERQFDQLPGIFSGLGINANYVYTESERPTRRPTDSNPDGFVIADLPFSGSPEDAGSVGVTYSKHSVDADLTYTWQDRRLLQTPDFGLFRYNDEIDTLDFNFTYQGQFNDVTYRLFFQMTDILKGSDEASLSQSLGGFGDTPVYGGISRSYFGGRSFTLGFSTAFSN